MKVGFLDGTTREIANLSDADLRGAYLRGASLRGADLSDADLGCADLRGASLRGANLRDADLGCADLSDADLSCADLRGANLGGASLRGANLSDADLRGAYLRGANLRGANLRGADLKDTKFLETFVITPEGDLIGWKKVSNGIVKLRIPVKAARVNAYGSRKCRAAYAVVLSAPKGAVDTHSGKVKYTKGRTVRPDKYDPDARAECSHGIHFFITEQEAKDYD